MKFLVVLLVSVTVCLASRKHHHQDKDVVKLNRDSYKNYLLSKNKMPKDGEKSIETCLMCEFAVKRIGSVIQDPATLAKLKSVLDTACDELPEGSMKTECKNLADNLPTVIHQLEPFFNNPETFCTDLKLCGSADRSSVGVRIIVTRLYRLMQRSSENPNNDILCDECLFAAGELKKVVNQAGFQEEMKDALDQVCGYLGGLSDQCQGVVNVVLPELVQMLKEQLSDPKQFCGELGACTGRTVFTHAHPLFTAARSWSDFGLIRAQPISSIGRTDNFPRLQKFQRFFSRLQTRDGTPVQCLMCKLGLNTMVTELANDASVVQKVSDGIRSTLVGVFPTELQAGLNDFLDMYLPSVLKMTILQINPKVICADIDVCPADEGHRLATISASERESYECEGCKTVIEFIRSELQDQGVQDELKMALDQICNVVPGQYSQQCNTLINDYLPDLLQSIIDQLDPEITCQQIHLCSAQEEIEFEENNEV